MNAAAEAVQPPSAEELFRLTTDALKQLTAQNKALLASVQCLSSSVTALTDRVTELERLLPAFQVEG